MGTLNDKQMQFVAEYLIDLNATQAATRAGYSARTANEQGARLLANVSVREALQKSMKERSKRTEITQDRVLQELARIAFFDIRTLYNDDGTLKRPDQLSDDAGAVLTGIDVIEMAGGQKNGDGEISIPMFTKKTKIPDKVAALSLAMRHLGMLKDKMEHSGPGGIPLAPPTLVVNFPEVKKP